MVNILYIYLIIFGKFFQTTICSDEHDEAGLEELPSFGQLFNDGSSEINQDAVPRCTLELHDPNDPYFKFCGYGTMIDEHDISLINSLATKDNNPETNLSTVIKQYPPTSKLQFINNINDQDITTFFFSDLMMGGGKRIFSIMYAFSDSRIDPTKHYLKLKRAREKQTNTKESKEDDHDDDDDGNQIWLLPRIVYKSNSDGVWRITPGATRSFSDANPDLDLFLLSKGKQIHYTQETKPIWQISLYLDKLINNQLKIQQKQQSGQLNLPLMPSLSNLNSNYFDYDYVWYHYDSQVNQIDNENGIDFRLLFKDFTFCKPSDCFKSDGLYQVSSNIGDRLGISTNDMQEPRGKLGTATKTKKPTTGFFIPVSYPTPCVFDQEEIKGHPKPFEIKGKNIFGLYFASEYLDQTFDNLISNNICPDFNNPNLLPNFIYYQIHAYYGNFIVKVYKTNTGIEWHIGQTIDFNKYPIPKIWIEKIKLINEFNPINSYGLSSKIIDTGLITNKPLEYTQQSRLLLHHRCPLRGVHELRTDPDFESYTEIADAFRLLKPLRMYDQYHVTHPPN